MKRQTFTKRYPLVSICITSYNYELYIDSAVKSALTQSYPNIEVIVSDNCSTDGTFERLAAFRGDPRLRSYINEKPLRMVENHNVAVRHARGEYIVVLSADDVLLPHHVATLMARIQDVRDPVDMAFGQATYGDDQLAPVSTPAAHGILPVEYSHRDEFASMLFVYSRALSANLIPRSAYQYVGYFDEQIEQAFEVDFALRVELADFRAASIPDVVVAIRAHQDAACVLRNRDMLNYHCEKLTYLEKLVTEENAWRLEYLGRHVANVLEFERAMISADRLDEKTLARSQRMSERLRTYASEHRPWPSACPRVSLVLHSHGAAKQLFETLDDVCSQDLQDIEILVVQTRGLGIGHLLQDRPYSGRVRYVKAPHISKSGGVLRLGIELARAPYVAYLEEGQTIPPDHLASLVSGIEANNVDFVYTDASAVRTTLSTLVSDHNGETPFVPVQRGEVLPASSTLSFSQMLLRRNLLMGIVLFDSLYDVGEQEFIEAMKFHFPYVFFERRAVTEFVLGSGGRS